METKMTRKPLSYSSSNVGKTSPSSGTISHTSLDDEKHLLECYEFGRKLGEGSFGVVWLVTHRTTGHQYACKTIIKDKVQGQRIPKLIEREVNILKGVSHENIIELKEVFETSQKIYLIMELCEGGELSVFLQEHGRFSEDETRTVMQQLARAISYLHKHGKVHRDLKLENILLSKKEDLCIKVTDFGLSIEKGGVGPENMMDDYCGTPMYMSPEIVEYKTYSEKCDVWAMGVIMFKLLTGAEDQRLTELTKGKGIRSKLDDKYFDFLSSEVKDCLVGMMRWDPAHRFTADEFLDHPWMNGQQLEANKPRNVLELMKEFRGERNGFEDVTDSSGNQSTISLNSEPDTQSPKSNGTRLKSASSSNSVPASIAVRRSSNTSNCRNARPLHTCSSASSLPPSNHPATHRTSVEQRRQSLSLKPGGRTSIIAPPPKLPATVPKTTTNGVQSNGTRVSRQSVPTITNGRQKSSSHSGLV